MEVESVLKLIVLVIGFYMAWNIGANDVSNAMGTSVGSGALTLRRAVFLAAILEFSGAFFVGSNVSETVQKGLIDTDMFLMQPNILILGCAPPSLEPASGCRSPPISVGPSRPPTPSWGPFWDLAESLEEPMRSNGVKVSSIVASWIASPCHRRSDLLYHL